MARSRCRESIARARGEGRDSCGACFAGKKVSTPLRCAWGFNFSFILLSCEISFKRPCFGIIGVL
jgi:hypothetical protein